VYAVHDLAADPDETVNVMAEHPQIVQQALARVEALTGPLPAQFNEYEPRCNLHDRFNMRCMNSFAPIRWPREE